MRQNAGILNRRGFSLIELLVVTAILGVVIAAIAGSLAGGIKVWDAARNFNEGEAAAALALAELERDLVNSFDFFDLSFSGHKDGMAFPGVVSDPEHGHMAVGWCLLPWTKGRAACSRKCSLTKRGGSTRKFWLTASKLLKSRTTIWQRFRGPAGHG